MLFMTLVLCYVYLFVLCVQEQSIISLLRSLSKAYCLLYVVNNDLHYSLLLTQMLGI